MTALKAGTDDGKATAVPPNPTLVQPASEPKRKDMAVGCLAIVALIALVVTCRSVPSSDRGQENARERMERQAGGSLTDDEVDFVAQLNAAVASRESTLDQTYQTYVTSGASPERCSRAAGYMAGYKAGNKIRVAYGISSEKAARIEADVGRVYSDATDASAGYRDGRSGSAPQLGR